MIIMQCGEKSLNPLSFDIAYETNDRTETRARCTFYTRDKRSLHLTLDISRAYIIYIGSE